MYMLRRMASGDPPAVCFLCVPGTQTMASSSEPFFSRRMDTAR